MYDFGSGSACSVGEVTHCIHIDLMTKGLVFLGSVDSCVGCAIDNVGNLVFLDKAFYCVTVSEVEFFDVSVDGFAGHLFFKDVPHLMTKLSVASGY